MATREPEKLLAAWRPFLARIGVKLGRLIEPWVAASATELAAAFKSGKCDLAWVGNVAALEIVESGAGEVFAQMVTGDGRTGYQSIFVTHKSSRLQALEDVHRPGKKLVFGDGEVKSTSGHLVPMYYAFVKRGIHDPATLFAAIRHGSHRSNLAMAARREVDFASANNVELDLFRSEQPELAAQLRVIWESPPIPHSPLLWSVRLPMPLRRRVQETVAAFGKDSKEEIEILRGVNDLQGFRKSKNSQLITVADIEMFAAWQKINNDEALSPSDKVQRIAAISKRASRLELMLKLPPSVH
jgi:phosphonate transport system substrate-binding protein